MTILELAIMALRAIGVMSNNPALGGGGLRGTEVRTLTEFLANLLTQGQAAYAELKEFAEQVKAMAAAGQEPTPAQWATWKTRDAAARQQLSDNLAALKAQASPSQPAATKPQTPATAALPFK